MKSNEVFSIVGVDSVSKFIDALTTKNSDYTIIINTDDYQSIQPPEKRSFMIIIASKFSGEKVTIEEE